MTTHQLTGAVHPDYIDPRRGFSEDRATHIVQGPVIFTADQAGTTTTIVGANADPTAGTNVARLSDNFKLFDSTDQLKEETVFEVDSVGVGISTTVTFSPAAAVATALGDYYRLVGTDSVVSHDSMDERLLVLGFSQEHIDKMTQNDKLYQIRVLDDPGSL